jgi:hypothetical protein
MPELTEGCVKPARGPIVPAAESSAAAVGGTPSPEGDKMIARVGSVEGQGFKPIRLSDYKGKWIVLCFYPGDFTFV